MNEAEFIAALRRLPLHPGARNLDDDAAVIEIGGETLVVTHDSMAEGTHFRADANMADVAWKLVATNLSDLAAMGAKPVGVLVAYALGDGDRAFIEGLEHALTSFRTSLLGGDTIAATGARTFGLTAIGTAMYSPVPRRSGARPGDAVYVTGILGRAMLGFEGNEEHRAAFERPFPRIDEGCSLAPVATAMMDISDGLLLDAYRMAQASHTTIAIDSGKVPVADHSRHEDCLRWGDDYELLFTLPSDIPPPVEANRIGFVEQRGFAPLVVDGHPLMNAQGLGFQHS